MYRRRITSWIAIPLLAVACSTPGTSSAPSTGGAASTKPDASQGGGGGGVGLASADITITGGDYAGHYEVALVGAGGCSTGASGPGTFGVASVTVEPAGEFIGPQITIYDADAASGGTDQFSAVFPFGNFASTVEVNPYLSRGSGTATLANRGSSATVTIDGTSANGETVSATIECHTVTNL